MLKHKSNCICNKSLLCCAPKPNIRKQKNKLDSHVKMQTMSKINKYINMEIYRPWMISESWYLDIASISLAWLRLLDSNVQFRTPHATFKGFCIGNFTCSNCFNKVFVLFKAHPCTLWDEPHPPCWNSNDAQQDLEG